MPILIERLESFNRKERFFLVGAALGNPRFRLAQDFRTKLGDVFGLDVPHDAFAAMDYHLDWMHVALLLADKAMDNVHSNDPTVVTGNQEDVDLLVAFREGSVTHLLLIEAKAETGWTNKQMSSKARRLRQIFCANGLRYPTVRPHFSLMSPRPPQRLDIREWPTWMTRGGKPIWLKLSVPPGRRRIFRCDNNGRQSSTGGFFRLSQKS